jgi:hypothetical protein
MTMALNSTQAPAQTLGYNAPAGSDAAGQSDGGTKAAEAPICYYPLARPQRDDGRDMSDQPFMGSEIKGTVGYDRFADTLMKPRPGSGNRSGSQSAMDRRAAEAAVDGLMIKPGTILRAPCHPDDSPAYRVPPALQSDSGTATDAVRRAREVRQAPTESGPDQGRIDTATSAGEKRVGRSAYTRDSGLRRSFVANGATLYPDAWPPAPVDATANNVLPPTVASHWRRIIEVVASLASPMSRLVTIASRHRHDAPTGPAARGAPYPGAPYPGAPYPGAPYPGASTGEARQADDVYNYERHLVAMSHANAN